MTEKEFKKARNIILTIYVVAIILAISTFIVTKVRGKTETPETETTEAVKIEMDFPKFEYHAVISEKKEVESLETERLEAERLEAERLEAERLEAERIEAERLEAERLEAERIEAERIEAERVEKERFITIIAKVIYAEARGEPMKGKIAVGASVVNRLVSNRFPNNIEKVIKAYANISWVTEEMLIKLPQCREAAERAVAGEDPLRDILGGPTFYFYNPDLCSKEALNNRKGIETYRIGNHLFYTSTPDGRW